MGTALRANRNVSAPIMGCGKGGRQRKRAARVEGPRYRSESLRFVAFPNRISGAHLFWKRSGRQRGALGEGGLPKRGAGKGVGGKPRPAGETASVPGGLIAVFGGALTALAVAHEAIELVAVARLVQVVEVFGEGLA